MFEKSKNRDLLVLKDFFSVFLAIYPILCLYKGFFRFTLGDVLLMAFLAISFLYPEKNDNRVFPATSLVLYSGVIFLLNLFVLSSMEMGLISSYFFRFVKLVFYLLCAYKCGKKFFNPEKFEKTVIITGVVVSIFIAIQYVLFYVFEQVVIGKLPLLEIYVQDYAKRDFEFFYSFFFRPSSFFFEPAQLSQYTLVPFCFTLFSKHWKGKSKWIVAALLMMGVVLSTSGQGMVYMAIIIVIFVFSNIKSKKNILIAIVALGALAVASYFIVPPVRSAVDRLLFNDLALEARIGGYKYIFELEGIHFLIGYGYGKIPDGAYMPGAAYVWYGCGIIGLVLAIVLFVWLFVKAKSMCSRIFCVCFFIMFWATSLFYSYMLFWYMCLILWATDNEKLNWGGEKIAETYKLFFAKLKEKKRRA